MGKIFQSALFILIVLLVVKGDDQCYFSDLQTIMIHLRELATKTNDSVTELQEEITKLREKNRNLEITIKSHADFMRMFLNLNDDQPLSQDFDDTDVSSGSSGSSPNDDGL